jgi:hypothetical protein
MLLRVIAMRGERLGLRRLQTTRSDFGYYTCHVARSKQPINWVGNNLLGFWRTSFKCAELITKILYACYLLACQILSRRAPPDYPPQ